MFSQFSFSQLIGTVDTNAAAVLCVMFITACIVLTTFIGKRRSKTELKMQFDIDKNKLANEELAKKREQANRHEAEMFTIGAERDVKFRRIETGLIEGKVERGSNFDK